MRIDNAKAEEILARVQKLTDTDLPVEVIRQVIEDAAEFVCVYTNRAVVSDDLLYTVGDLAIVKINRLGVEGDASRSEAGESYTFEAAPAHIFTLLNKRRIAKVGGYNAVQETQDEDN